MSVLGLAESLAAALRSVEALRVHTEVGDLIDPPAAIICPPEVRPLGSGPTALGSAVLPVVLVVASDDRPLARLWPLLEQAVTAIETVPDAVVVRATPGSWPAGGATLPAYLIEIEAAL